MFDKMIDYSEKTIGRLTFIEYQKIKNEIVWKCKCQCGNEQNIRAAYISMMKHKGSVFECSKCKKERKSPTLTDKVFGRLKVIKELEKKGKDKLWLVRCECGVEKEIISSRLTSKSKSTKSCGCLSRKINSRWVNTTQYPPAHNLRSKITEDLERSLYEARNAFVAACYNVKDSRYKIHGYVGHTVCELWRNGAKDFVNWALKKGYKKGYGIYLKPNKKEFSPLNCKIQSKNEFTKTQNAKFITFNNKTQSITDWSKELDCSIAWLSKRLKYPEKYPIEKIMKNQIK